MNSARLIEKVQSAHQTLYGKPASHTSLAPGRVNLLGEHTDYNDGFVLPAAIDFFTCVSGTANDGGSVSVTALDFDGDVDHFDPQIEILPSDSAKWKNYIRGAFHILKKSGYPVLGCDLTISGNIPKAAGLSSSASLEVALLNTLSELFKLDLSKTEISILGQKIEIEYVGLSCGIMDQLSCACGQKGHALMIDCQDLNINSVSIPPSLSLMIVNSNVERQLTNSGYNDRRRDCEMAADLLGINSLREISLRQFRERVDILPPRVAKRVEHVLTENDRVVGMVSALDEGNTARISKLMAESHHSMSNHYEITTPEIDFLVKIIDIVVGKQGGVRMTGGGFGGCVIALLPDNLITDVQDAIDRQYEAKTSLISTTYICRSTDGVKLIV
tara:strand:- start:53933 stop:55093 length:1161 start_codon:yes stop_codon:yes gene_type:complete